MTYDSARRIAEAHVATQGRESGIELALVDEVTMERDFGWVFFYDSEKHIASGSISDALAGNAPFIVSRADGSIHETGTAYPIQHYIDEFSRKALK